MKTALKAIGFGMIGWLVMEQADMFLNIRRVLIRPAPSTNGGGGTSNT